MGEYGWLGELSGCDQCRGSNLKMHTSPFIAAILGVKDGAGRSQKSGFYFRLFLQQADGRWVAEPSPHKTIDPDKQAAYEAALEQLINPPEAGDEEDDGYQAADTWRAREALRKRFGVETSHAAQPIWPKAADLQEQRWICYAWPNSAGRSGIRCFVVNEEGEVWQCNNVKHESGHDPYDGTVNMPMAMAAFGHDGKTFAEESKGERGQDGRFWHPSH